MKKLVSSSLSEFLKEAEEPVALGVLGAPAGGKSYTMNKIKDVVDDSGVLRNLEKGEKLTVDKLRDDFQSKNSVEQLRGFVRAFYYMRSKAKEDPEEFKNWYYDIAKLWATKLNVLMPELKIDLVQNELMFGDKKASKALGLLNKVNSKKVIKELDSYNDYKRVVRYFQNLQQTKAVNKKLDVSYDEAGDEPKKIIKNLQNLHKNDYITDLFLIHPKNVASNLIQNFYRVTIGEDGGRDSSQAIIGAYNDIEQNKDLYTKNSEGNIKVPTKDLSKVAEPIKNTNVPDDLKKGDKPIDLFVEVEPMDPPVAYKTFMGKLDKGQKLVFNALLKYSAYDLEKLPQNAKDMLLGLTNKMSNEQAVKVLRHAAKSGKYVHKFGGVTPKLAKRAAEIIK